MVYLYQCQKCGKEQEIECKLSEKDEQSCLSCGAPPKKMKAMINLNMKTYKVNISASQWKV